jgi:hypothetical protein
VEPSIEATLTKKGIWRDEDVQNEYIKLSIVARVSILVRDLRNRKGLRVTIFIGLFSHIKATDGGDYFTFL